MNSIAAVNPFKGDFSLPAQGSYLLNHSVGRPLKSAESHFLSHYFSPWQQGNTEPWQDWLSHIEVFQQQLAKLFNHQGQYFCPQSNLSSGLCKLLQAHTRFQQSACQILMSEQDFPSMGFAVQQALPHAQIHFIPSEYDMTDIQVWKQFITEQIDLVFISQVYSNTGQQAPVHQIVQACQKLGVLSLVDVAQSAGILPLDLSLVAPDFMLGSAVKWLCSGPGAAYLWVHPKQLAACAPKDVGWFSHENPFEFDIHNFRFHQTALKFWGGTPSIAPYVLAAHSLAYFNQLPTEAVRTHNLQLLALLHSAFAENCVSPSSAERCSGTAILQFGQQQDEVLAALKKAHIAVDARKYGIRVSPHIYNDKADIDQLIAVIKSI
ncbi:aminotransferase class V-fold PLP-dependent enzyme [Paraglaciecola aestuariivivens]